MLLAGNVQTEKGVVCIEASYQSEERASMDGYEFDFHSEKLNCDLWKCPIDGGNYTYAIIDGFY